MILVIQAIGLVRLISEYDVIFTMLGGEYKAAQNRFRELGVLPKFHGKNFLKIKEYPGVDDFEVKTSWCLNCQCDLLWSGLL